jgi:peptide deformylase
MVNAKSRGNHQGSQIKIVPVDLIPVPESIQPIPENLFYVYDVSEQMKKICEDLGGAGLAAVQVGIPWRLFVCKFDSDDQYRVFVDAKYTSLKFAEKKISIEGCLSLRDLQGNLSFYQVERFDKIVMSGKELLSSGEKPVLSEVELILHGFSAVLVQHEIDHQNGVMISHIGKPIDLR